MEFNIESPVTLENLVEIFIQFSEEAKEGKDYLFECLFGLHEYAIERDKNQKNVTFIISQQDSQHTPWLILKSIYKQTARNYSYYISTFGVERKDSKSEKQIFLGKNLLTKNENLAKKLTPLLQSYPIEFLELINQIPFIFESFNSLGFSPEQYYEKLSEVKEGNLSSEEFIKQISLERSQRFWHETINDASFLNTLLEDKQKFNDTSDRIFRILDFKEQGYLPLRSPEIFELWEGEVWESKVEALERFIRPFDKNGDLLIDLMEFRLANTAYVEFLIERKLPYFKKLNFTNLLSTLGVNAMSTLVEVTNNTEKLERISGKLFSLADEDRSNSIDQNEIQELISAFVNAFLRSYEFANKELIKSSLLSLVNKPVYDRSDFSLVIREIFKTFIEQLRENSISLFDFLSKSSREIKMTIGNMERSFYEFCFMAFDTDHSGTIDKTEFMEGMNTSLARLEMDFYMLPVNRLISQYYKESKIKFLAIEDFTSLLKSISEFIANDKNVEIRSTRAWFDSNWEFLMNCQEEEIFEEKIKEFYTLIEFDDIGFVTVEKLEFVLRDYTNYAKKFRVFFEKISFETMFKHAYCSEDGKTMMISDVLVFFEKLIGLLFRIREEVKEAERRRISASRERSEMVYNATKKKPYNCRYDICSLF